MQLLAFVRALEERPRRLLRQAMPPEAARCLPATNAQPATRVGGEGSRIGPELTDVGSRLRPRICWDRCCVLTSACSHRTGTCGR